MVVYGTRPEAIKVAPVIHALARHAVLSPVTVVSGQHREMLDAVNAVFAIRPDHDLDVFAAGAPLARIFSRTLERVDALLASAAPDAVLVQGDTSTAAAAALAAFYRRVPVVHLEAGLRTHDLTSPFPEELNRRQITQVAGLHLAPTAGNRSNLLMEGVQPEAVVVTGNTGIDALHLALAGPAPVADPRLREPSGSGRRLVLVTAHRRENLGPGLERIGRAVRRLALQFGDVRFVTPLHRNPAVRRPLEAHLSGLPNVVLTDPLDYLDFARLLARAHLVLSDSGGVQEEAPGLGVPVVLLRDTTERPEGVDAGTVLPVGTDEDRIVEQAARILSDPAAHASVSGTANPYGDGHAAARAVQAVAWWFGRGRRPDDFVPEDARPRRLEAR
ncbi:UDP-N-acetylglucosamine 2-epimerase [Cellulomonas hominis]|nr:UDP-N-acetylglucosamine 2-epimerase [Cellulomonas hominis]